MFNPNRAHSRALFRSWHRRARCPPRRLAANNQGLDQHAPKVAAQLVANAFVDTRLYQVLILEILKPLLGGPARELRHGTLHAASRIRAPAKDLLDPPHPAALINGFDQ